MLFRKLILAIFVLGLFLMWTGTAIADRPDRPSLEGESNTIITRTTEKAPVNLLNYYTPQSTFKMPILTSHATGAVEPQYDPEAAGTDTTECFWGNHYDFDGCFDWYLEIAGAAQGTAWSMRFDSPDDRSGFFRQTLFYAIEGADNTGLTQPSIVVSVYEDNGGVPGAIIYSEEWAPGSYALNAYTRYYPGEGTNRNDYGNPQGPANAHGPTVLVPPSFHVAVSTVGGDAAYSLVIITDDGGPGCNDGTDPGCAVGTGRSSYYDGADWYATDAVMCGDVNLYMYASYCYYWHECREVSKVSGSVWWTPFPNWEAYPDGDGIPFTDGSVLTGVGQRFVSETADTIHGVYLKYADLSGAYMGSWNQGLKVGIYPDLAGSIDYAAGPINGAEVTLTGTYNDFFPDGPGYWCTYYVDFLSYGLVMTGPWHVVIEAVNPWSNGQYYFASQAGGTAAGDGSVNFSPAVAPNVPWELTATSYNWQAAPPDGWWDVPTAFYMKAYLCKDEFEECVYLKFHQDEDVTGGVELTDATHPAASSFQMAAQRVMANPVNRLQKIGFQIGDDALFGESRPTSNAGVRVGVWPPTVDSYGLDVPDTDNPLYTVDITAPVYYPGWNYVVIPDVQILGDFFVGYEGIYPDPSTDYLYALWTTMGPENINGGFRVWYRPWEPDPFAAPGNFSLTYGNLMMEVEYCMIPVHERTCWVEDNFPMFAHDMYRTGASGIGIGDAWCDLNLTHHWNVVGTYVSLSAPIIFDGRAICAFYNQYKVFDLISGAVLATFTGTPQVGEYVNATPMVITVDILGTPTDLLLCPSGTTRRVRAIDLATYAEVWLSERFDADVTWGNLIYLNGVIYASTANADVYALNATDGTFYTGWGDNPVNLGLNIYVCGGTDGENIYIGTVDGASSPSHQGDLYKLDATDGTTIWEFSAEGGFQGVDLYDDTNTVPVLIEGFFSGLAFDAEFEVFYANTVAQVFDHPADGVFYIINTDGSLVSSAVSQRSLYNTPIIDQTRVYIASYSRWADPPLGGNIIAFRKEKGDFVFAIPTGTQDPFYSQAILTCETEAPDLLFATDYSGFMYCVDMDNEEILFSRRVDHGLGTAFDIGCGMAMGRDADENVHILSTDRNGDLYDFTKGDDRPRLQLNSYKVKVPVEPGTDPAAIYYIDDIITNTGCAPLNIYSCVISTEDTGSVIPNYSVKNIRPDVFNKAASIADMLTTSKLPSTYDINSTEVSFDVLNVPAEKSYNKASAATYLENLIKGVYCPAVVGDGETVSIELTVDETVVQRGGALFHLVFDTDDPDFFLNSPPRLPQIQVIAVGGCLIDTVRMNFGMGGENAQLVTNTGRVGDGDWDPHAFEIDGDGASYYQGSYIYGVSKYRIAMNSEDWWSNTGEGNGFFSMQADPNWCDNNCSPYMTDECDMGEIWDDATSAYVAVEGYMVCKTYLDSVQAFYDEDDEEDGWTWRRDDMEGGYDIIPFDDTLTIGLMVHTRTFGAVDVPGLTNFTLEVMDFNNRNDSTVDGWYFGHYGDMDVGSDTVGYDGTISTVWSYTPNTGTVAWGSVKIPFGPGYDPIINGIGLFAGQTSGITTSDGYYDSAYWYMSNFVGSEYSWNTSQEDAKFHFTFAQHDFEEYGTFRFAVANFGLVGLADATVSTEIAPLAYMANKWAGFGRGDVDNDNKVTIADYIYLNHHVNAGGNGPKPFAHLGDLDNSGTVDAADLSILRAYYFYGDVSTLPWGDWAPWTSCVPTVGP